MNKNNNNSELIPQEEDNKPPLIIAMEPPPKNSAEQVVNASRAFFNSGQSKCVQFRKKQLKSLEKFIDHFEDEIVEAIYKDLGKPKQEVCMGELSVVRTDLRHTLYELDEWAKPSRPEKRWINLLDGLRIHSDPYGVVLVIGAWNFPFMLAIAPLVGAIAGGNSIILKPPDLTPLTSSLIALNLPHYFPPGYLQVVTGGVDETTKLLQQRFDYIFFTGSTSVGKIIHQAANKYLTPTTLELGGKCPVYLHESADLTLATRRIVWGKFMNAGQVCVAPDYLLCTKAVENEFVEIARNVIGEFYGDGRSQSPFTSRILSDKRYDRLARFVSGGNVVVGGQCDPKDRYISPTILGGVTGDDDVMAEEIFGPILPVVTVSSDKEAVDFINARDKPLALYVFSGKKSVIDYVIGSTSSGSVCVNDTIMQVMTENIPFGGVGASGMGAYHGKQGFDTFTHKKGVLVRGLGALSELLVAARYPPYSERKIRFLDFAVRKRRGVSVRWMRDVVIFAFGVGVAVLGQYLLYKVAREED